MTLPEPPGPFPRVHTKTETLSSSRPFPLEDKDSHYRSSIHPKRGFLEPLYRFRVPGAPLPTLSMSTTETLVGDGLNPDESRRTTSGRNRRCPYSSDPVASSTDETPPVPFSDRGSLLITPTYSDRSTRPTQLDPEFSVPRFSGVLEIGNTKITRIFLPLEGIGGTPTG